MAGLLFWNMSGKDLSRSLVNMLSRHDLDVVFLAESPDYDYIGTAEMNEGSRLYVSFNSTSECGRIRVYSRQIDSDMTPIHEGPRFTFRRWRFSSEKTITIGVVHLQSRLHKAPDDISDSIKEFARTVTEVETDEGHQRTLIVGDFNANPFDSGLVSASGMHAVAKRTLARQRVRIVDGHARFFFFNPMWSFFGERGPGGTYYYRGAQNTLFWNMFDQVLVRPQLLSLFRTKTVRVLTDDGTGRSFLTRNRKLPNARIYSDHLPICFRIDGEKSYGKSLAV